MINMKKVEIDLNETQVKFLKEFAEKHFDGAKDNAYTANALHVVQSKVYIYVPYSWDVAEYYEGQTVVFCTDSAYEYWYTDEKQVIQDWYESEEEELNIPLLSFEEANKSLDFVNIYGKEQDIFDYEDYFKAYGVEITGISWRLEDWENVAYFFILDEAKRYIEYQRHNLMQPRTYTIHPGYANKGDFIPFRDLLLTIGKQLNQ